MLISSVDFVIFCPAAVSQLQNIWRKLNSKHKWLILTKTTLKLQSFDARFGLLTYDGNRSVIREHHVIKPSVIIIAELNASKPDIKLINVSINNPKNVESFFACASINNLFHWNTDEISVLWEFVWNIWNYNQNIETIYHRRDCTNLQNWTHDMLVTVIANVFV